MDIESFILQKEFDNINFKLRNIQEELQKNTFNLFTLSSYNSYLENFHSDIIAILLNSEERHKQNDTYLKLFFDYLINQGCNINKDEYALCEITREKGRIDIWIKDCTSKKSIIIENKINDAVDQENQLESYYQYAKEAGFNIDSVVYITLNGSKKAPLTYISQLNEKIINIPAFIDDSCDLCNGWLKQCYNYSDEEDNRSFIYQYIKLIKHLSQTGMDKQIRDDFYSIINKKDGFQKTKAIAGLVAGLEEYRAQLFATKIANDYLPFRKMILYRPNHWLFENFYDNGIKFKLDVHFHDNGSARIDFWNPGQPEEVQKLNTFKKLNNIGLDERFEYDGFGGGMFKVFDLEIFGSIQEIDKELFKFVNQLFRLLR